jgi:hypothetical protein
LKQKDDDGNAILEVNPDAEHVVHTDTTLRIVSPMLVAAVDERFSKNKAVGMGWRKNASRGAAPSFLLTHKLACPICGGHFIGAKVAQKPNTKRPARFVYECSTHRKKGAAICPNTLRVPVDVLEPAALRLIDGALNAELVERVCRLVEGSDVDGARQRLEAERDALAAEIRNLLALAKAGAGDVAELAAKLKATTVKRDALNRQIATLPASPSRSELRAVLEQRVSDWKARLLSEFRDEARLVLDQILAKRSIVLWAGTTADFETAEGFDPDDTRGKENLEPADCFGFEIDLDLGMFLRMVAGAGFEP